MKLRNKKTGEIVSLSLYGITLNIRRAEQPTYYSIEQLCEEWEDYNLKEQRSVIANGVKYDSFADYLKSREEQE